MPVALGLESWPGGNLILSAIPASERRRWLQKLDILKLPAGRVLHEGGGVLAHVYFPVDCVLAVLRTSRAGSSSGVALIGREGLMGVGAALGDRHAVGTTLVQTPGSAYRLPAGAFADSFMASQPMRAIVLRYISSMVGQLAQTSLCNSQHSVERRLCRWLLETLDRVPVRELNATQELIGTILGVRREAVTLAAMKLEARGAIRHARGHLTVANRALVEAACCECYALLRGELDRLERDLAAAT
jgi:CRP-like cAMP-binding protein